jgi:NAD(P)-dependent dehydrogenase (short-subunit alcohol dehydrogenase family)
MTDTPRAPTRATASYPDLEGRVVFISGGASGIGRDLVEAFAGQRATVLFVDLDEAAGTALARLLGGGVQFLRCDVTDDSALKDAVDQAETMGGLDVLINNAANDLRLALAEVTADDWQRLVDVNLRHQFFASQRAAHHMAPRGCGSIINFGSVAPEIMVPNLAVYSACKSAVRGLTRSLAKDLGPSGIRVNSILPGAVLTEKQRTLWYPDQVSIDAMVSQQCIKRELSGWDVAQMALFLASDVSLACTAQDFIVDGGIL